MKRLLVAFTLFALVLGACGGAGGGAGQPAQQKKLRIALVTDVGGLNDKSFNMLANQGRLDAERELKVETRVTESRQQADYVPNLTSYAQQGYDLIISVGFLMTNATWKVAKQFPNVKFAIVDGAPVDDAQKVENLPNVANLFFAEQEAGYLVGVIAAEMVKARVGRATNNTVCSMGGIPIPPVDKFIAGYQHAVQTLSPTTKIINGYSNHFVDQQKGKEVGLNHIDQGCDILFQVAGGAGLGYIAAARERNKYAIGVDADQAEVAPGVVITSALKRVNKAVYDAIKMVSDGSFKGGDVFFNARNDGVGYGKLDAVVPAAAKAAVDKALADIKAGTIRPKTEIAVK